MGGWAARSPNLIEFFASHDLLARAIMMSSKQMFLLSAVLLGCWTPMVAAPVIDPINDVSVPAGKSLTIHLSHARSHEQVVAHARFSTASLRAAPRS